jgi:hypothetical protein
MALLIIVLCVVALVLAIAAIVVLRVKHRRGGVIVGTKATSGGMRR